MPPLPPVPAFAVSSPVTAFPPCPPCPPLPENPPLPPAAAVAAGGVVVADRHTACTAPAAVPRNGSTVAARAARATGCGATRGDRPAITAGTAVAERTRIAALAARATDSRTRGADVSAVASATAVTEEAAITAISARLTREPRTTVTAVSEEHAASAAVLARSAVGAVADQKAAVLPRLVTVADPLSSETLAGFAVAVENS